MMPSRTSFPISPATALLALGLALLLSLPARAQAYEVVLRQVAAENTGQGIDPELKDIRNDLQKLSYTTCRLERTDRLSLDEGQSQELGLLGENRLILTAEGFENGKIRLRVKLSPRSSKEEALETVLRISSGNTFLIGGPSYGEGVLILAFTARR